MVRRPHTREPPTMPRASVLQAAKKKAQEKEKKAKEKAEVR